MKKVKSGDRFGTLVVSHRMGTFNKSTLYECQCDCGKIVSVRGYNLHTGKTKSCGCLTGTLKSLASTKHGTSSTRLYRIWKGMMSRCYNKNNHAYNRYGARGIKVFKGWHDCNVFVRYWGDIKPPYTLDRINNNKGYYPKNCWVADSKYQANNRVSNKLLTYNGKTQTVAMWIDELNLPAGRTYSRSREGKSAEEILNPSKRELKIVLYEGESITLAELSRRANIPYQTLMGRYNRGAELLRSSK